MANEGSQSEEPSRTRIRKVSFDEDVDRHGGWDRSHVIGVVQMKKQVKQEQSMRKKVKIGGCDGTS